MGNYSLAFLETDWDGAGYDFSFACVFDQQKLNQKSIAEFVSRVANSVKSLSVRYICDIVPNEWRHVDSGMNEAFAAGRIVWENTLLLVLDIVTQSGFSGYVELNQPDQVEIGGPSRAYYTGNSEVDLAISSDIVLQVANAIKSFGSGFGSFGPGSGAMLEAVQIRSEGRPSNLMVGDDLSAFSRDIFDKCRELRDGI